MENISLEGVIERVLYRNQTNGYAVLHLNTDDFGTVTVTGTLPPIGRGERLMVEGSYVTHPQYGQQFKIESAEVLLPQNEAALIDYLSSGFIHGVGPATASRIVERFGMDTLDVIESEPERLCEIRGVSPRKAREIASSYTAQASIRALTAFLQSYGIEPIVAIRLYSRFGPYAVSTVRDNPYIMADDFFGMDFTEADRVAFALGHQPEYGRRLEAGLLYVLSHNLSEGHVFLPQGELIEKSAILLELSGEQTGEALEAMIEAGDIVLCDIAGIPACYLTAMFECECYLTARLLELAEDRQPIALAPAEILRTIESEVSYSDMQLEAITAAASNGVMILTGGPGTGKTTTVRGMLALFDYLGKKVLLTAPTGRAAKRLSELSGREAKTIHRLLEADLDRETGMHLFLRNDSNPLDADILILDESSMVDLPLMANLMRAMRSSCRLILVGDSDQLPPVGPGCVLADAVRSGAIRSVILTEIFRQARQSAIVTNAHLINHGEMPELNLRDSDFFFLSRRSQEETLATVTELCTKRLPERMGIDFSDIQVLSPSRRNVSGTESLNLTLQQAINPPSDDKPECRYGNFTYRVGDRIMQIKNNYELFWSKLSGDLGKGVFNGDTGIITDIDPVTRLLFATIDDRLVTYTFEQLNEIEPAYAITVHKAQGSEYRAVILCAHLNRSRLLNRNLLYTAVTRARELLIIVGNEQSIRAMVENNRSTRRFSGLRLRLSGEV